MYQNQSLGEPIAKAVDVVEGDSDLIKEMKQLILEMTSYYPKNRPLMPAVYQRTLTMFQTQQKLEVNSMIQFKLT